MTVNDHCSSSLRADTTEIDVTLSINLNEHVLEQVPYIVCIVTTQLGGPNEKLHRSQMVYLQADNNCTTTKAAGTDTTTTPIFSSTENSTDPPMSTSDSYHCLQYQPYPILCTQMLCVVLLAVLK